MKHRSGFVSNSSSSSFILELNQPYEKEWMQKVLFGGVKKIMSDDCWHRVTFDVSTLMDSIDQQFAHTEAKIETFEQFVEEYSIGWGEGPDFDDPKYELNWDLYNKDMNEYKEKRCHELWPQYEQAAKEGRLYSVEFADNDGKCGAELEHYTPWTEKFKGMRFSHH